MRLHLQLLHPAPRGTASPPEHVEVPVTPVVTMIRDASGRVWRVIDIEADLADDAGARMIAYVLPGDPGPPPPPPPHALTVQEAATAAGAALRMAGAPEEMIAAVQRLDGVKRAMLWALDYPYVAPILALSRLMAAVNPGSPTPPPA